MKFHKNFRYGWWVLALVLCGLLFYIRRDNILNGNPQTFDTVLLAITAALLLLPLYSELTILGVSLKQQVEETKKELKRDIKEQINSLRIDFQTLLNISSTASSQVIVNPPPDDQLQDLVKRFRLIIDGFQGEFGVTEHPQPIKTLVPSDETVLAFSSRYQIEKEITRLWSDKFWCKDDRPRMSTYRMMKDLISEGILPEPLEYTIREVLAISSPAVHGEEPSPEKMGFLNDVVPPLLETLRAIKIK